MIIIRFLSITTVVITTVRESSTITTERRQILRRRSLLWQWKDQILLTRRSLIRLDKGLPFTEELQDIDGREGMKLIYGIIAVGEKVRPGKDVKSLHLLRCFCLYLGGYDKEDKAARAYDLAALKYWNTAATTNFPITNYSKELEEMKHMTKQEFIASLRRKSSGFSRGASMYRGVTRHHQQGRWQARIGRVAGNKDLYLGTFGNSNQ
ncbi:BnaCnng73930D [Brassica napus]|uniref:BnaCnng73930D protein n=1 Tax=Brassica napus TaxID=3708 RepID=A0A078K1C6_BRANA|nr:BnaCnng73930D [Brassica napus]